MRANNHYFINDEGDPEYNILFRENPTFYTITVEVYNQYTVLPPGYTDPSGGTNLMTSNQSPSLVLSEGYGKLIGYSPQTIGNNSSYPGGGKQFNGDITPEIDPVSSVNIVCNAVENELQLNKVLYSFLPDTEFGGYIKIEPASLHWHDVQSGLYHNISLAFEDDKGNKLQIIDNAIQTHVVFRDKPVNNII